MKRIFIAIVILMAFPASGKGSRAVTDSLLKKAAILAEHGKFEASDSIYEMIAGDLSKRGRRNVYGMMAINADLSGRYDRLYTCLQQAGASAASLEYAKALVNLPLQSVSRPSEDVRIRYDADSLFYKGEFRGCEIRIPVEIGGREEMMIFDNGCAKFSFASESFARSHGISPIGFEGQANGVVDTASMWLGICDSLSIGELMFCNVLFIVVPDSRLENPVTNVDAIVGTNILRMAGEMVFDNVGRTITFMSVGSGRESNMRYGNDGLQYLDVSLGGDTLCFQLDIGASKTSLNARYYKEYKSQVESSGRPRDTTKGGLGGFVDVSGYEIPDLVFSACGGEFLRKETFVSVDEDMFSVNNYGSIGADFLLSFGRVVLNVQQMYLYVSD